MNTCWMLFHPLSNGLIIGFKHPVFVIDVCRYKNPTCYLIQIIHWLFLSLMSHLFWFVYVENMIFNIKCVGSTYIIFFHRCVWGIIPLIILVGPLAKTVFSFYIIFFHRCVWGIIPLIILVGPLMKTVFFF